MNILKRSLIEKLGDKYWTFDDDEYAVTEVSGIDWDRDDEYIRVDFFIYPYSDPEDFRNCTLYASRTLDSVIIEEINVNNSINQVDTFYFFPHTNDFYTLSEFEEYEAELMEKGEY